MSRYRKIDPRFWRDEKVRELDITEKVIALYLFTGQSNRTGLFNFSPGEAMEDLGIPIETFAEGWAKPFGNVCRTLNLGWDQTFRVLYLPTWWKYNCPENPNVLKACLADLHEVPQTPLLIEFSDNLRYLPETFHQTFREGLPKPSPQRMADQEQEQEQDKEEDPDSPDPLSLVPVKGNSKKYKTVDFPEFETAWNLYPKRAGGNSKKDALDAWLARIREGEKPSEMIAGVQRYAIFCRATNKEHTEFVKQGKTFFGPAKHYLEEFELPRTGVDAKRSAGGFVG